MTDRRTFLGGLVATLATRPAVAAARTIRLGDFATSIVDGDSTAAFQAALKQARVSRPATILVPPGTWRTRRMRLTEDDQVTIVVRRGAALLMISDPPSQKEPYLPFILVAGFKRPAMQCHVVVEEGAILRHLRPHTSGEHRHIVRFGFCQACTLSGGGALTSSGGDAVYVGGVQGFHAGLIYPRQIEISGIQAQGSRNAISVTSGDLIQVRATTLNDSPTAGLDIEPNSGSYIGRVEASGVQTRGCHAGVVVYPRFGERDAPTEIRVSGHRSVEDHLGFRVGRSRKRAPGNHLSVRYAGDIVAPRTAGILLDDLGSGTEIDIRAAISVDDGVALVRLDDDPRIDPGEIAGIPAIRARIQARGSSKTLLSGTLDAEAWSRTSLRYEAALPAPVPERFAGDFAVEPAGTSQHAE